MKNLRYFAGCGLLAASLLFAGWFSSGCASRPAGADYASLSAPAASSFLYRTNYKGWEDSIWMGNGKVEAIVVPSIGRVMQFRFAGAEEGPFWENDALAGRPADPAATDWMNFGGDKVWPAPQSSWGVYTVTNWPPPVAFDQTPVKAEVDGWVVTLVYPEDEDYGIKVTRTIELLPEQPALQITTRFIKSGLRTVDAGIWVVTQLKDPLALYALVPSPSIYPSGYQTMSTKRPPSLNIRDRLLSLDRDPAEAHKIGLDVGALLWMTEDTVLRVDSPRRPYRNYPDEGTSAAIYTSPDPLPYVEFQMISPVLQMRQGDVSVHRSTYTLLHRRELDPVIEANLLLER